MSKSDSLSQSGAQSLAATIREYWRAYGYEVNTMVVDNGKFCSVRSDMVNGLPRDFKDIKKLLK